MPLKTAATTTASPLSAADIDFLMLVLKEVKEFKVDWSEVADKASITRKDNATTKFQNVLKKLDGRLFDNKIMTIAEAKAAAEEKKRKAANKDDEDEDEDNGGPTAKKAKKDEDDK